MKHLKNIINGNAKTPGQFQLTQRFGVVWLFSEDEKNWYEEQKGFSAETIKIAYDKNNIIVGVSNDISTINPDGLSVVELPDTTANRRADISGNWQFIDGKVIKRIYTSDELRAQAEVKKTELLSAATVAIAPLQDAVDEGMATAEETAALSEWRQYRVKVRRVDTSNPEWPPHPDIKAT